MQKRINFDITLMGIKIRRLLTIKEKLNTGASLLEDEETLLRAELDIQDFDDKEKLKERVSEFFSRLKTIIWNV
jgi:hypothetical protein